MAGSVSQSSSNSALIIRDNFVLYVWATDWFRQQSKNLEGADYFEKVYKKSMKRSPLMAKYALLEKAQLSDCPAIASRRQRPGAGTHRKPFRDRTIALLTAQEFRLLEKPCADNGCYAV